VHAPSIARALKDEVSFRFIYRLSPVFDTHLSIEILEVRLHGVD
jgi:hypothetical protein